MNKHWIQVLTLNSILVLSACLLPGCGAQKATGENEAEKQVPVVLGSVEERTFNEHLVVQGNVLAKNFAMVGPLIPGTITDLFVEEGDAVIAKETKLFQIDKVKVQEAVQISKQDLALARCQKRETQANLDSSQAQFDKAKIDYERFQRLFEKKAVTADVMEQQTMRYKAMKAGLDHALSLIDLSAEQEKKAVAALAIAEKNLEDSLIYAPISGRISLKLKEEGEFGSVGSPIFRIEDLGIVEVSAFLPAEYYAQVKEQTTKSQVQVYGIDVGALPISYKSPTIQPQLRTFQIKCLLENPPEGVTPGAIADIEVMLRQEKSLGVPTDAIQERGAKEVIFVVDNHRAKILPVETGLETKGYTAIQAEGLKAGMDIVVMGQYLLDDGSLVSVREQSN